MKPPFMFAIVVIAAVLVGCSSNMFTVRPTAVLGTAMYTDVEYAALKAKNITIDDLAAGALDSESTKLMPQTKVQVLRSEQLAVSSDVAAPVQWPFQRVRVVNGPSTGQEGWISARQFWDGQPVLEPAN